MIRSWKYSYMRVIYTYLNSFGALLSTEFGTSLPPDPKSCHESNMAEMNSTRLAGIDFGRTTVLMAYAFLEMTHKTSQSVRASSLLDRKNIPVTAKKSKKQHLEGLTMQINSNDFTSNVELPVPSTSPWQPLDQTCHLEQVIMSCKC